MSRTSQRHRRHHVRILTLVALLATTRAGAQSTLRLADVYRAADARSPSLAAATAEARAARARVSGASLPPDPQLQLGIMNRSLPSLAPMAPLDMTQIQLMQMIPLPGKLGAAGRVARAQAGAADARALEARRDARAAAAMSFYDLYAATRSLQVAHDTRELLRATAQAASAMYAVGRGRQADVLRAQVEIARMTEDVVRMESMRATMRARLAATLDSSVAGDDADVVLPRFPDTLPPLDSLVQLALGNRPMLDAARKDVDAATASARLARQELWPDLTVGLAYAWRQGDMGTDHMGSLMLGASIPIFAGKRQLQMREEASAMRDAAQAELRGMEADTRARVTELWTALERDRRLDDLYRRTVLPQASATVQSSLAAYRTGGVDLMTLLDNQMAVNRYSQELYTLQAEQGKALAELEMLVGRDLVDASSTASAVLSETDR